MIVWNSQSLKQSVFTYISTDICAHNLRDASWLFLTSFRTQYCIVWIPRWSGGLMVRPRTAVAKCSDSNPLVARTHLEIYFSVCCVPWCWFIGIDVGFWPINLRSNRPADAHMQSSIAFLGKSSKQILPIVITPVSLRGTSVCLGRTSCVKQFAGWDQTFRSVLQHWRDH